MLITNPASIVTVKSISTVWAFINGFTEDAGDDEVYTVNEYNNEGFNHIILVDDDGNVWGHFKVRGV